MIKLEVEIKDEKFCYSYQIGEDNRHSGTSPLCADSLAAFTDLLRICSNHYRFRDKEWEREALGKAWVEKMEKEKK